MGELTADAIRSMPAGFDLDALVAKHVFGREVYQVYGNETEEGRSMNRTFGWYQADTDDHLDDGGSVPHYSTDVAAAIRVAERIAETEDIGIHHVKGKGWFCGIKYVSRGAGAETIPLAICRAALLLSL